MNRLLAKMLSVTSRFFTKWKTKIFEQFYFVRAPQKILSYSKSEGQSDFRCNLVSRVFFSSSTSLIKISGDEEDERKNPQNEVFQLSSFDSSRSPKETLETNLYGVRLDQR